MDVSNEDNNHNSLKYFSILWVLLFTLYLVFLCDYFGPLVFADNNVWFSVGMCDVLCFPATTTLPAKLKGGYLFIYNCILMYNSLVFIYSNLNVYPFSYNLLYVNGNFRVEWKQCSHNANLKKKVVKIAILNLYLS